MNDQPKQRLIFVICFSVACIAIAGYFTGLQAPMNPPGTDRYAANNNKLAEKKATDPAHSESSTDSSSTHSSSASAEAILATDYSGMGDVTRAKAEAWKTTLTAFNRKMQYAIDPMAEVKITVDDKMEALAMREVNRAFNGAPPTVPHPTAGMVAEACASCHTFGVKTESMRISAMSHPFLSNCTQCHVEVVPKPFAQAKMVSHLSDGNSFVGMPAPTEGPRAFEGAPPQIPHSVWMRENCMSCHGYNGLHGIRTTHPWQTNCQQCHANASKLNQVMSDLHPSFLPAPSIKQ